MANNRNNRPSGLKIGIKAVLLIFIVYLLIEFMVYTVSYVADGDQYDEDVAYLVDNCNRYYYEKQYGELYDYLVLYDAYGEEFDMYWECVNGYIDYIEYEKWAAISEERMEESTKKAEYYRQKVTDNAKNCQFEQNRSQLEYYANDIKTAVMKGTEYY